MKFGKDYFIKILAVLVIVIVFIQCQPDPIQPEPEKKPYHLDGDVAITWNKLYLELEKGTPGYYAVVSARNIAYINLAAYASLVPGMKDKYNPIASVRWALSMPEIDEEDNYAWNIVLNSAYKTSFEYFFPSAPADLKDRITETYDAVMKNYKSGYEEATIQRSIDLGEAVSQIINGWSRTDITGHDAFNRVTQPSYVPPSGPGKWEPTKPDFTPAGFPYWGEVRAFVLSRDNLEVSPPVEYSTDTASVFYKQALETYILTNAARENPDSEDAWIAQFWSDDCIGLTYSTASRWISIMTQVLEKEKLNLAESVVAYTRFSIALCDVGICAWRNKYKYNVLRPIDYISDVIDPEWQTLMCPDENGVTTTPASPAYPSAHASFAAAAAGVLEAIFGKDYIFTDKSHKNRTEFNGTPRTYQSFTDMAEECAYSRLPLGVQFRMSTETGLGLGYKVADAVNGIKFKK